MCDTLCVRTPHGMLFAKNSDRHPDEIQVIESYARRAGGGELRTQYLALPDTGAHALVGSRPAWLWGCEHGVNEHQVAIGNEKIWTVDDPRSTPPALLGMDLVRLGLERGRSADDALDTITTLLEHHGQGGSGEPHHDEPYYSSFLVADTDGGWVVETSNRTWVAEPVGDGTSISNRVCVHAGWTRASASVTAGTDFDASYRLAGMPTGIADHRLAVTRALTTQPGRVDAADIARALRDHGPAGTIPRDDPADGSGVTVCMHRRDVDAQTTASMIVELRRDTAARAWAALGNPCVSVYVPFFPPAIAPGLADPAQWQRFAALRDRVEKEPGELANVRAVLAPVEAELWAAAADADATGSDAARAAFATTAFAPVDGALLRLGA